MVRGHEYLRAKIFNGEASVEEAFTQAAKEINEILATEKK